MNRNTESHFSLLPNELNIQRSRFDRSSGHKTTFNAGDLVPFYVEEVLPGDTFEAKTSAIIRMTTPIFPVMDNAYIDTYYFFVPNRLVWEHWQEFMGENKLTAWEQPVAYEIPKINAPTGGFTEGGLADHFGIPTKVELKDINHLPFRAYCKIWNDWFRNENTKDAAFFNTDETTLTGKNKGVGYDYVTDTQLGAGLLKAAKFHDYFTSALPSPQKGQDVPLPIGNLAPVIGGENRFTNGDTVNEKLNWYNTTTKAYLTNTPNISNNLVGQGVGTPNTSYTSFEPGTTTTGSKNNITPGNLWADLSTATGATINQLRQAFQLQKFYERDARGGTRYIEMIKSHFGVDSPDARLQRSEYLGGNRNPINIESVTQTSATQTGGTPQGNVAALSVTGMQDEGYTKSFTEHGYVLGIMVVRTDHTYQQGLNRMWSRKNRTDFYFPVFANLGEQAILNKEIYAQGEAVVDTDGNIIDNQAFGYQEAWADYRYKPSQVTGLFRSNAIGTLDSWHYADEYASLPVLSSEWNDETDANIQRTLAIQNQPQFIADIYTENYAYRPMPLYSVPGLIDHH